MDLNKLMIYDIDQKAFTKSVNINPNTANLRYLYVDDQGKSCFKICRSAEMVDNPKSKKYTIIQEQKF